MSKVTIDGNTAAAKMAYAMSDVSAIYPITPSSTMAEVCDEWASANKKNIFGNVLKIVEMQSEAGAVGAVHGSLAAGELTTTFTASQGLLLMIPNMFKLSGELLPAVFHVSARAVATHALSIFGDHSDVMACRSTGFCMLASSNVQESLDNALVAHIAALKSSVPFLHFFDGFRTSHEIQKIDDIDYEDIKKIFPYDKLKEFKERALNPKKPHQQGTAQNPDVFFQNREACNKYYNEVYDIVVDTMKDVEKITGRKYAPFEYYGAKNPEKLIVVMGSGAETIEETIENSANVGMIKVKLYRPFNVKAFTDLIPQSVKVVSVLDRTKESGAIGEPLYLDVISAIAESGRQISVIGGRYGLGSKEFTCDHVLAVIDNMDEGKRKNHFTVGINDDVTHTSLEVVNHEENSKVFEMKFFGLGSDGTVGANKNSIKIIGENTDKYVQGYFEYDSKKSGSVTISHLRVSDKPIKKTYLVEKANFIACHNFSFLSRYNILSSLKNGGTVLLNTALSKEELVDALPENFVCNLKDKGAKFYILDAQKIANKVGLGNKINVIMQTAFFKLSEVIPFELAEEEIKKAIKKTYGKKGDAVVNMNITAVDLATSEIEEVDVSTLKSPCATCMKNKQNNGEFYDKIMTPISKLEGNQIPVSSFTADGYVPTATSKLEKRGIALNCPDWNSEKCIQCGRCVMVCPHGALRAVLVNKDDLKDKPEGFTTKAALGVPGAEYRIQLSALDCTGCGVCANVCIAKDKALEMKVATEILDKEEENRAYAETLNQVKSPFNDGTVKGVQFNDTYFEFSGACAGCGETPYVKLVTQLFGRNMIVANATGCSSIYGGSYPACPYTTNKNGEGPAWANSLFEDNAEFGLGMSVAVRTKKENLATVVAEAVETAKDEEVKAALENWLQKPNRLTNEECDKLVELIEKSDLDNKEKLLSLKDDFYKKSVWIFGGDGWAYDIGYGGLDHALASGENVNILVLDTEVYSNTGGQASKSSPSGMIAKFAAGGKKTQKKDLALMAICHKDVYVAKISMGANMEQAVKAIKEAENYDGPSIILAYAPCINHGFNLTNAQAEMKKAVDCGYWDLYRYNPLATPSLTIDSQEPTGDYLDFLKGETRYSALIKKDEKNALELFEKSKEEAAKRRAFIKKLAE